MKSALVRQETLTGVSGSRNSARFIDATDEGSPRKRASKSVKFDKTDEIIQYTAPTPEVTEDNWDAFSLDSCESDLEMRPLPALPDFYLPTHTSPLNKFPNNEMPFKSSAFFKKGSEDNDNMGSSREQRLMNTLRFQAKLAEPLKGNEEEFDFGHGDVNSKKLNQDSDLEFGTNSPLSGDGGDAKQDKRETRIEPKSDQGSKENAELDDHEPQLPPPIEAEMSPDLDRPSMELRMDTIMNGGSGMSPVLRGGSWHRRTGSQMSDLSDGGPETFFPVRKLESIDNIDPEIEQAYWRSQRDSALARQDSLQEDQKHLNTEKLSKELPQPPVEVDRTYSKRRKQILQLLDPHGAGVEQTVGFKAIPEEEEEGEEEEDDKEEEKEKVIRGEEMEEMEEKEEKEEMEGVEGRGQKTVGKMQIISEDRGKDEGELEQLEMPLRIESQDNTGKVEKLVPAKSDPQPEMINQSKDLEGPGESWAVKTEKWNVDGRHHQNENHLYMSNEYEDDSNLHMENGSKDLPFPDEAMDSSLSEISDIEDTLGISEMPAAQFASNSFEFDDSSKLEKNVVTNDSFEFELPNFPTMNGSYDASRITYYDSADVNRQLDCDSDDIPSFVDVGLPRRRPEEGNNYAVLPWNCEEVSLSGIDPMRIPRESMEAARNISGPIEESAGASLTSSSTQPKDYSLAEASLEAGMNMPTPEIPARSPERIRKLRENQQDGQRDMEAVKRPESLASNWAEENDDFSSINSESDNAESYKEVAISKNEAGNQEAKVNASEDTLNEVDPEVLKFITQNDGIIEQQNASATRRKASTSLREKPSFLPSHIPALSPLNLATSPFLSNHIENELDSTIAKIDSIPINRDVSVAHSFNTHCRDSSLQEHSILKEMSFTDEDLAHLRRSSLVALYENDNISEQGSDTEVLHKVDTEVEAPQSVDESLKELDNNCSRSLPIEETYQNDNELLQDPVDISIRELHLGEDMASAMELMISDQFPSGKDETNDTSGSLSGSRASYVLRENTSYVIATSPQRQPKRQSKIYEVFNEGDGGVAEVRNQQSIPRNRSTFNSLASSLPRAPSAISSYCASNSIDSKLSSIFSMPIAAERQLYPIHEPVDSEENELITETPIKPAKIEESKKNQTAKEAWVEQIRKEMHEEPTNAQKGLVREVSVREVPVSDVTMRELPLLRATEPNSPDNFQIKVPRSRASTVFERESIIGLHNEPSPILLNQLAQSTSVASILTPAGQSSKDLPPVKPEQLETTSPIKLQTELENLHQIEEETLPMGYLYFKVVGITMLQELPPDILATITVDNGVHCVTSSPKPIASLSSFNEEYKVGIMPQSKELSAIATIRLSRKVKTPQAGSSKFPPHSPSFDLELGSDGCYAQVDLSSLQKVSLGKRRKLDLYVRNIWAKRSPVVSTMQVDALYIPNVSQKESLPLSLENASVMINDAKKLHQTKPPRATGPLRQYGGDVHQSKGKMRYCVLDSSSPLLVLHSHKTKRARTLINLAKATKVVSLGETGFEIQFRNKSSLAFKALNGQQSQMWLNQLEDVCGTSKGLRPKWIDAVLYES